MGLKYLDVHVFKDLSWLLYIQKSSQKSKARTTLDVQGLCPYAKYKQPGVFNLIRRVPVWLHAIISAILETHLIVDWRPKSTD